MSYRKVIVLSYIPSAYYTYNQNIARAYFIAAVHWPHIEIKEEVKDTERLWMLGGGSEGSSGLVHALYC